MTIDINIILKDLTDSQKSWIESFRYYVNENVDNIDDDQFLQLLMMESRLGTHGRLPKLDGSEDELLSRMHAASEIYRPYAEKFGPFPDSDE